MLTCQLDPSTSTPFAELPALERESEVARLLSYAKIKLLAEGVPMQLKAISYLRLCCIAIRKLTQTFQPITSKSDAEYITDESFSTLLAKLYQHSSDWWQHCWVSDRGILHSHHAEIDRLLQGFGYFVEMYAYEYPSQDYTALSMFWKNSQIPLPAKRSLSTL